MNAINHSDNAVNSTELDLKGTRGPRSKYFFCAAIQNGKIIHEAVQANSDAKAREMFEENHGLKPSVCDGGESRSDEGGGTGYYLAKGTGMSDSQRLSVTVTAENLRYTPKRVNGEFKGWNVIGNCIQGFSSDGTKYEDNELVTLLFQGPVSPVSKDKKVSKPKLKKTEAIRVSDIKVISWE